MVKLTAVTLAFIISAVQCAVVKTEDVSLIRSARSAVPNGPLLHTQNWSGLARSADGQNTIFSGASAAADQGSPTAGSAFSLAASGPLATAQDGQSSDSKTKQAAEKPSISSRFGGDDDDQQSVVGGGKFISGGFKESQFSYHSGGGVGFGYHDGIAPSNPRGFGSASSASSSARSGGVNGYHGFGQGNSAFGTDLQAQGGYKQGNNLNVGFGANSAASGQSKAVGSNYGAGIGRGYGGRYIESSNHGKHFENQGGLQQTQNQQQSQGFGSTNDQAHSNSENSQQAGGFGSSDQQQKSNLFENGVSSHELQNSGLGIHGGFQDSGHQQSQSAGQGTSSSPSAQSGAFGGNNGAGKGYGESYTVSSGHEIQQADKQKQSQGLELADTGAQTNDKEATNGQQSGGFGSTRNQHKHELQNSGFGAHGGFQDSSNQKSQSAGFGTTSLSSSQSGAFEGNNYAKNGYGYGGRYTESSGRAIQQAGNRKQYQGIGSANIVGSNDGAAQNNQQQSSSFAKNLGGHELQSSSGGSQFGQGSFGSSLQPGGSSQAGGLGSSSFEGQSALKGALDLASQGLQASGQSGCSTCGKSSLALSNAKSHTGSAVALSISG